MDSMAVSVVSAQVILKPTSGIPADFVTNTFHFTVQYTEVDGTGPTSRFASCAEVRTALVTMYDSLRTRLGGLQIGTHEIKFVDLGDPKPRLPCAEFVWAFTALPPAAQLPAEVAIVCSFQGTLESGINPATRKNRVFMGPLATSLVDTSGGRVTAAGQAAFVTAFAALAEDSSLASDVWVWIGYSPKLSNPFVVQGGWVDNAFDTQRRRGTLATSRGSWTQSAEPV